MNRGAMTQWPPVPGNYQVGDEDHPVAIAVVGRGLVDLREDPYALLGTFKTENMGIERIMVNVVTNPNIRFIIVCGREEFGHFPGDALLSLINKGTDQNGKIRDTRAAIPYICNIDRETVERFREQVEVIDLVHPKEVDEIIEWNPKYEFDEERTRELLEAIQDCEERGPGPFSKGVYVPDADALVEDSEEVGRRMNELSDQFVSQMLRMPSQKLNTSASLVLVSEKFRTIIDPIDGQVSIVPSIELVSRMKSYLTGTD